MSNSFASQFEKEYLPLDTSGGLFRNKVYTIGELLQLLESGKLQFISQISLNWATARRARSIESLLMGMPPANIVIDGTGETWYVVEGEENLKAWLGFVQGKTVLKDSILFLNSSSGMSFAELPPRYHSRFINCRVLCSILSPDCDNFTRLWFYWSTLQGRPSRNKLWDYLKVSYPQEYATLQTFCKKYNITNEWLGWNSILSYGLTGLIQNPESVLSDNKRADRLTRRLPYDFIAAILFNKVSKLIPAFENSPIFNVHLSGVELLDSIYTEIKRKLDREQRIGVATLFLSWCLTANCNIAKILPKAIQYFLSNDFPYIPNRTVGNYIEVAHNIIERLNDDTHN